MESSNKPNNSRPVDDGTAVKGVNTSAAWLHLKAAAITGLCVNLDEGADYRKVAEAAAAIADAGIKVIADRVEIIKRARAVVAQQEPDEE